MINLSNSTILISDPGINAYEDFSQLERLTVVQRTRTEQARAAFCETSHYSLLLDCMHRSLGAHHYGDNRSEKDR